MDNYGFTMDDIFGLGPTGQKPRLIRYLILQELRVARILIKGYVGLLFSVEKQFVVGENHIFAPEFFDSNKKISYIFQHFPFIFFVLLAKLTYFVP